VRRAYDATSVQVSAGDCTRGWNRESGYSDKPDKEDVGLVKCYSHEGRAWIQWYWNDLKIYAYAVREDGNRKQLLAAWRDAGPVR
jgi:hypothetical protein